MATFEQVIGAIHLRAAEAMAVEAEHKAERARLEVERARVELRTAKRVDEQVAANFALPKLPGMGSA
jgi:hypothetical protein